MAAVPVRRAASGPAPCELAASRSARTKGRLARLLEQDEEGPRYVCSLRLERDLMERSGRMGSKSSVGDMSTEGDGEGSVSRTWSKGSAGEDNMSRAWSKSSTGEDNMSRAWSKGSAIPFFGHSPSWSASSDHSPRADGLTRFGMPLDMVAETESGTASNELGEAFRGPLGQATLAPGVMPVMLMPAEVAVAASPTYAAGQDSRPSRTIALSVQPELSASARPPSPAALSAGGPSAAQPRRMSWADVSLTAQPSQECSHEVFQPASCGVRHQPGQRAQRPRQPPHQAMQQQRQDEAREQQQLPAALKGSAQRPDDEVGGVTMRDLLRMLKDKEHRCVILTRRIQYLGFSAPTQLEDHFGAFGPVQETAAGAAAAFAAGAEHEIGGATIVLEPFDEARWKAGSGELEQQ
ncbi:unnamed protein product [Prorocentrum cordatum]|uniref:Uncharacterized protein n=1 Tax=Prorocentrum cordatum TaxID=2364126 RepID=A0ABN9W3W8_9DINO|nr:unnamed protein product [Polarella glacialis]